MQNENFEILRPRPDRAIPLIIHIPHTGRAIPSDLSDGFRHVDPSEIDAMIDAMRDEGADTLFAGGVHYGATVILNRVCRVAYDPERFEDDDREFMSRSGLGMVYTHTLDGKPLRPEHQVEAHRRLVIERYHRPYVAAFEALVDEFLERFGAVWILDAHTFPEEALSYEDAGAPRPVVCLGYESEERAQAEVLAWFDEHAHLLVPLGRGDGSPDLLHNTPYAGSYVPPKHMGDPKVKSVMLEVNRGCRQEFGAIADAFGRWLGSFIDERVGAGRQPWPKPLATGVAAAAMIAGSAASTAVIGDVLDGGRCRVRSDATDLPGDSRIRECWVCRIAGGELEDQRELEGVVLVDKWTLETVWCGMARVVNLQGETK